MYFWKRYAQFVRLLLTVITEKFGEQDVLRVFVVALRACSIMSFLANNSHI